MRYSVIFTRIDDEANETVTVLKFSTQSEALAMIASVYENITVGTRVNVEQEVEGHYVVTSTEHFNRK